MENETEDEREYKVVLNHEEQYSIWFADRELPLGWRAEGKSGQKKECLDYIDKVWTDMRPLSLRREMEADAASPPPDEDQVEVSPGPTLVERLSAADHVVEVSLHPQNTVGAVRECLAEGYIHLKFPETKGGTLLVVDVDQAATDSSRADFDAAKGSLHIEGTLTLDFERVRCLADIDLGSLSGRGRLKVLS